MSGEAGERLAYFDAVLFDVDGTLIHSSPGILDTMEYTFAQMGVHLPQEELKKFLGPPLRETFGRYCKTSKEIESAVLTYREYYRQSGQYQCSLFPGVVSMLNTLRDAGVLLCTATSKPTKVVLPMLERLGIEPLFQMVGGASLDASLDTKEAVVRHVLEQPFMQGRRVLMVGDRRDDVAGAGACGLPTAGVLYGYGGREELETAGAAVLMRTCEELTEYILAGQQPATQEVIE